MNDGEAGGGRVGCVPDRGGLEFLVLGPLEVRDSAGPISVGGRRQRAVLALLALNAGRFVPAERLIEGLWGEEPPPTAPAALQNAVSQLRKLLESTGSGRSEVLLTQPGGYLLHAPPEQVDALRFESLVSSGRRALADGRARRAVDQLREALELWRGNPLEDLSEDSAFRSQIVRLDELRLAALEDRFEAELALDRHAEMVTELRALTDAHPYRERLWGQLMVALYRCGRQADALDAYQRLRKVLAGDLGLEPSQELQRLEWDILNQDSRLRAGSSAPDTAPSLPVPPTPFIGRQNELDRVVAMLGDPNTRLLTLTGPPGTGKTRLALAAVSAAASSFDHVCFVELAPLSDPELILPETAVALGLREPGQTPAAMITRYAQERDVLVVLDNFEHLLSGAAQLAQILTTAPRLRLLVTSRIALRLSGEREYGVPPLALPDLERLSQLEELRDFDALAFFVDRAQAVLPDFELTADNAWVAAELCVRLDGLPLAIALAASRLRVLSPELILARLGQRLQLLTDGPRDAPARHRTLRTAMEWSYDLLGPHEQALFSRLSVFAGGWTLDAAEQVANADGTIEEDVVMLVGSLLEQSLLRRTGGAGALRFSMLESLREYALQRLQARGELEALRAAHARYFTALAEEAYRRRFEDEGWAAAVLEVDQDNLRAALEWASVNDPAEYTQLAGAVAWFWTKHWLTRSQFPEGRRWLELALRNEEAAPADLARARTGAALLAALTGDAPTAVPSLESAVALWTELDNREELAFALDALAWAHFLVGETEAASDEGRQSMAIYLEAGHPDRANAPRVTVAQLLVAQWKFEEAEPIAEEALTVARCRADVFQQRNAWHLLGDCALMRGDPALAERRYREALRLGCELRNRLFVCIDMQGVAMAVAGQGHARLALRLAGAAAQEYASFAYDPEAIPFWKRLLDRYLGPAQQELGPDAEGAVEEGRQLRFEDATTIALDEHTDAAL